MSTESITKTELKKSRGWTDKLISTFLEKPDIEYPNPRSKKAGNIKLYNIDRIEKVEATVEFKELNEKTKFKKDAARRAVETKISALLKSINEYKPEIPILTKDELFQKAIEHYNQLWIDRGKYNKLNNTENPDEEFLIRISNNYLRHCLTDYEFKLRAIKSKVGTKAAYYLIKKKIQEEIVSIYPFLIPEFEDDTFIYEED